MASSDSELENEVRQFTDLDETILGTIELQGVIERAKRHIKIRRSLTDAQVDWYENPKQEDALFWATCLFSKVATGELDSQTISAGALDAKTLLAKDDDEVTVWYRNMEQSLRRIEAINSFGITSPERRTYGDDEEDIGDGGLL